MSTSTIPNHSQKQDDATTVIKLIYLKSGEVDGWNQPRSPAPQLLLDAGVPEAVWFATYDIVVERRNAFLSPGPKLQNFSWSGIVAFTSYCFTSPCYHHILEWIKVIKEQEMIYSAYGIKVMGLRTLTSPRKTILGGLQFNKVDKRIPEQRSFVQELEVLYRLHKSGGLTDDEYTVAKQRVIHSNNETSEPVVVVTAVESGASDINYFEANVVVDDENHEEYTVAKQLVIHSNNETSESVVVATAMESGASDINYFEANVVVEDENQQSTSMNEKENLLGG